MAQRRLILSDDLEQDLAEVLKAHRKGLTFRQQAKFILRAMHKAGYKLEKPVTDSKIS